mgnify:FL=1
MSTSPIESATPPVYRLRPSVWLRGSLISLFILALVVALGGSGVATPLRVVTGVLTLAMAAWIVPQHWPRQLGAIRAFQLESGHQVRLWRYDGRQERYGLRDTRVWPALVVLALGNDQGRRSVFIPRDALGGEAHRQLRRAVSAC